MTVKYELMIRARPDEDMASRHARLMETLSCIGPPWGFASPAYPPVNEPGGSPFTEVNLSRYSAKGIKRLVSYHNRKHIEDRVDHDDYFQIEFNITKERQDSFRELVSIFFENLLISLQAYRGHVTNREIVLSDFPSSRHFDYRSSVYRVHPVCFIDEQLCRRAFGRTAQQIYQSLVGHVEEVRLVAHGLLLIAALEPISKEQADAVDRSVKDLIAGSTPLPRSAEFEESTTLETGSQGEIGEIQWVSNGRFVLPEVPESLNVDPVLTALLHAACFLELSDDDAVDFDDSLAVLEGIAYYMGRLPRDRASDIEHQLQRIIEYGGQNHWDDSALYFIVEFAERLSNGS